MYEKVHELLWIKLKLWNFFVNKFPDDGTMVLKHLGDGTWYEVSLWCVLFILIGLYSCFLKYENSFLPFSDAYWFAVDRNGEMGATPSHEDVKAVTSQDNICIMPDVRRQLLQRFADTTQECRLLGLPAG